MANYHLGSLSKQLTIGVGLTVVGFMAFGLALSFYRNALFDQTLEEIRGQNGILRGKIDQGFRGLEYYRSAQYKDKYAKQNLGKISPGEQVLIITEQGPPDILSDDAPLQEQQEAAYIDLLQQMPKIEHWKLYFFYPERIEEIKRSL